MSWTARAMWATPTILGRFGASDDAPNALPIIPPAISAQRVDVFILLSIFRLRPSERYPKHRLQAPRNVLLCRHGAERRARRRGVRNAEGRLIEDVQAVDAGLQAQAFMDL